MKTFCYFSGVVGSTAISQLERNFILFTNYINRFELLLSVSIKSFLVCTCADISIGAVYWYNADQTTIGSTWSITQNLALIFY